MARDIHHFDFIPYNLYGLGAAACGLGDFNASRTYLLEAMTISVQWQVPEPATIALFFFAKLLTKESEASETQNSCSLRKRTQAVELLAFILNHPACWQAIKDRAVKLMTELEAALPSGAVAEARTRGRSLSLETVVSEIHVRNGADG